MRRLGLCMLAVVVCSLHAVEIVAQKNRLLAKGAIRSQAPPTVATISGNPLTINVGSDASFQVFNSAVPGTGQIFPDTCTSVADMGVFVLVGTTLVSPNFDEHCGTATPPALNANEWTTVSLSAVSGAGTAASPFAVTLVADAAATGVRMTMVVTYVNGENFFRINKTFTAAAATTLRVFEGADIYLAASDDGIPFIEPSSQSPGGRDCTTGAYNILFIPLTAADARTATFFATVWSQIAAGQLDNAASTGCQDNGAALQWNRTIPASGSVTILSAVSFGAIPSIATFRVDAVNPNRGAQGQTLTVTVSGIGFQAGTTFDFGPGIVVGPTTINSSTQATVQLTISPTAAIGFRNVTGTQSPGGTTSTLPNGFEVTAAGAGVDLRITKTASAGNVPPNSPFSYSLTVTNLSGTTAATNVVVTDTLPANVSFVSAAPSQGSCSAAGQVVTCSLGTLPAAAQATIGLNVRAGAAGPSTNTATVSATEADPVAGNNVATAVVVIAAALATAVPTVGPFGLAVLIALVMAAAFLAIRA